MCEELLGGQPVNIAHSFFRRGGDSVLATRLLLWIEELFGKRYSLREFVERDTIEQFARLLSNDLESDTSMVRMHPHGAKPKLFFIPGISGSAFDYLALGKALPADQPLFAFNSPILWKGEPSYATVEAMASHYIKEMLAVQARGPFYIGGWSFGAVVAFEMAQQLCAGGNDVALLALVDEWSPAPQRGIQRLITPGPYLVMKLSDSWHSSRKYSNWVVRAPWLCFSMLSAMLQNVMRPASLEERAEQLSISFGINYVAPQYIPPFRTSVRALIRYIPKVYRGHISLVRVTGHPFIRWRGTSMGWRPLAAGGLSSIVIPGDHFGIIRPPQVQRLADSLRDLVAANMR
jgi:thioesterase domain-containing protein